MAKWSGLGLASKATLVFLFLKFEGQPEQKADEELNINMKSLATAKLTDYINDTKFFPCHSGRLHGRKKIQVK